MRLFPQCMMQATLIFLCAMPVVNGQLPPAYKDSPEWPDRPAAQRAKDVLGLLNEGKSDQIRAYVGANLAPAFRDAFPLEQHVGFVLQNHVTSHGFDFHGVRTYDPPRAPNEIVAILRNRLTESWVGLSVTVEPDAPYRIVGMQLTPARPPSDLPPPKALTESEMLTQLAAYVDKLAKADAFSGTVLVAKNGKPLFSTAVGEANKGDHVPNKFETRFNLGSMNKMFTAVAIAQLVERGKLQLTDPLSKFLGDEWLPRDTADKIRIEHLLTHTSGLGSYFNDQFMKSSRELYRSVNDYKPLIAAERPKFEPGSDWSYSNSGFMLLGAVIEKTSGQDYFDYIRENVYQPAGMTRSDSFEMDAVVENLAIGYSQESTPTGTRWVNNLFKHVIKGGPAGGGFATAEDLLRFDQALRSGKLVSPGLVEQLWSPRPALHSQRYGYGFQLDGAPNDRIVGHSGGFPGISSALEMYLDRGYTVVVLSNYDNAARLVSEKLRELLPKK